MSRGRKFMLGWVLPICAVIIIGIVLRTFVFGMVVIRGSSMNDTLVDGDVLILNRLAYISGSPGRGDIVCAADPVDEGTMLAKRVIGLPGECVEIREGVLHIDGEPVYESYLKGDAGASYLRELGADEYLLMGDNRDISHDGRAADIGPIALGDIEGRMVLRLWPLGSIGTP